MGWLKINVDAACKHDSGFAGVGCMVRDPSGTFLRSRSNVLQGDMSPQMTEVLSLHEALLWDKTREGNKCIFESDSKLLVEAVNGGIGKSYFHTIVNECHEIIKHFEKVLIIFVHIYANMIAHIMSGLYEWVHTVPKFTAGNLIAKKY